MMETHRRTIRFQLNGRPVTADIATHETLVEVLRRAFGLFGGRESCGQGLCGCCTALVNGLAVTGCLYLAAFVDEAEVVTVEGLASGDELHPIQQSFVSNCGFQCGFCTPGFILMTKELLDRHPQPTTDEIRHYLSGNLCRCGAYPDIIKSVQAASK
jgi:aerobic carbon-monoxide dehydrogenase small subunit